VGDVHRWLRVPAREALAALEQCDRDGALTDHEYESSDAADEAFNAWERATADALDGLFADANISNGFRSGMNLRGRGRRATEMFNDRREKLLAIQTELLLQDLHTRRAELLAQARQVASHDPLLLLESGDAEKLLTRQIRLGEDLLANTPAPAAMNDRSYQVAVAKETDYRAFNVQLLRAIFDRNSVADEFDAATTPFEFRIGRRKIDWENLREVEISHGTDPKEIVVERIRRQVNELTRLRGNLPVIPRLGSTAPQRMTGSAPAMSVSSTKVFIVHGHNTAVLQEVARLTEHLGLDPIILREKPNAGATLIEKLEKHADVQFAIVLATADDIGSRKAKPDQQQFRARRNVIFELGFFVGRLGRNKVALLLEAGIEIFSDFHGVAYHELDAKGAWKLDLAKEVKAAGLEVDFNRLA
jgi:predicted nucleotide-binding protein